LPPAANAGHLARQAAPLVKAPPPALVFPARKLARRMHPACLWRRGCPAEAGRSIVLILFQNARLLDPEATDLRGKAMSVLVEGRPHPRGLRTRPIRAGEATVIDVGRQRR